MIEADYVIIGGGIAGAGLAYFLSHHGSVIILEKEERLGYHTTGRSAAFYAETYGGLAVQPLTSASKAFFQAPPDGFCEVPLLTPMGALHIFARDQEARAQETARTLAAAIDGVTVLTRDEVLQKAPYLAHCDLVGGIYDSDCGALDVAALHQGYLRGAKARGCTVHINAGLERAQYDGARWCLEAQYGQFYAGTLINSAGAWADDIAALAGTRPIGIQPLRRTIITVPNPDGLPYDKDGPMVLDLDERFYLKPEGGGYLVSPADETLSAPTDAQPELEDVALAAQYFEQVSGHKVARIDAKWAGLRSFAPDRKPVIGWDQNQPGFFWNVGQGGFGIQTSPAWSSLAASIITGAAPPACFTAAGGKADLYAPTRFG